MLHFKKLKLAWKLSLVIAVPTVALVVAAGLLNIRQNTETMEKDHRASYSSFLHDRSASVGRWLEGIQKDVVSLSVSYATQSALRELHDAWHIVEGDGSMDPRALYISENPHPAGQKDELLDAGDGSVWTQAHIRHHAGLRAYQRSRGYYDLFLFDTDGHLIYSVYKEDDFGLDFMQGKYASSGLGEAFRAASELKPGEFHMTNIAPYAPSSGAPAMFMAAPVFDNGVRAGVVAVQVPLSILRSILSDAQLLGESGELYLVDASGQVLNDSRIEGRFATLDTLPDLTQIQAALAGNRQYFKSVRGVSGETVVAMTDTVATPSGDRWGVVFEIDRAEAMAFSNEAKIMTFIELVVTAVLLCALSWFAARGISRRVQGLATEIKELSKENYDRKIAGQSQADEVGFIARTLVQLQDRLRSGAAAQAREKVVQENNAMVVQALSGALTNLAQGDFRNHVNQKFPEEHEKLRYSINDAMVSLNGVVLSVRETADNINRSASEISNSADDMSSRTESQAATLEQTAAALEQVTASVRSANEHVQSVESTVETARSKAEDSGEVVEETVKAMTEIEQSSEQISQIISVIDDIAFQTNLLALNAGVEAARAGEAGRGFAVVASEVRGLAQRSSGAALEIKALIEKSGQQVGRGVEMVGRTGDALTLIVDQVKHISDLVKQISQSSREQSVALSEINMGMSQLDQVTQNNAAMVEENTAAAHMLRSDAERLMQYVGRFRTLEADSSVRPAEAAQLLLEQTADGHLPAIEAVATPDAQGQGADVQDAAPEKRLANDKWMDF
ncbi:methyl-accepting chemotaxis protein [Phaeobacter sp. HF9A]|uniref:methyl-accepting chemotaxis protein n=1 Tax=Phaeobacter sp. HF9A TaxID=2721561 RepID=UPI00143124B1|nr:methyl-accepting chemotaxis protein [Phaeobacter sp. HF9A]NIZ12628.1 HAMP domain-containing protein [Phaeobacter sp. HF9A]